MLDIPISIIAWIAVVLVQALVHYFVFGARRERINQDDAKLEDSLSFNCEGSMEAELDPTSAPNTPTSAPSFSSLSSASSISSHQIADYMQTGTEILKVCIL